MRKKKLKGNEKLREVYANAASGLTVQFNELETHPEKLGPWLKRPPPLASTNKRC
jgi:hypothetical protein